MTPGPEHLPPATSNGTASTASDTFELVWVELIEILGSAATAALLRRSIGRRLGQYPELKELEITRNGFEYAYNVPSDWKSADERSAASLRALLQDLCLLLLELTGPVVVQRLRALPQLAKYDLPVSEKTI